MNVLRNTQQNTRGTKGIHTTRRDWWLVLPMLVFLLIMVRFPLRFVLTEVVWDSLFYGAISFLCFLLLIKFYRQTRRFSLMLATVCCILLSSWQIVDLVILREISPAYSLGNSLTLLDPFTEQWAWYNLRFRDDSILCHSLWERYYGNRVIAITVEIKRDATWFACGG